MSAKNLDNHNRWRNKTVAFRVSPEEDEQLEIAVRLSGLTKQDYITRRLLNRDIVVQGNPRVYKKPPAPDTQPAPAPLPDTAPPTPWYCKRPEASPVPWVSLRQAFATYHVILYTKNRFWSKQYL